MPSRVIPARKKRYDDQYGLYDGHVVLLVREGTYLNGQSDRARVCPLLAFSGHRLVHGTCPLLGKADIEIYAVVAWFVVLVVL